MDSLERIIKSIRQLETPLNENECIILNRYRRIIGIKTEITSANDISSRISDMSRGQLKYM